MQYFNASFFIDDYADAVFILSNKKFETEVI